jgi:hypothetical protein
MISYKDMTFCPFWRDCNKSEECDRPLTLFVIEGAKKWWNGDHPPICEFAEKPECHATD